MQERFTRRLGDTDTTRIARAAPLVAAILTLVFLVPAGRAKTVTLHYFSKHTGTTFVNPQGQPLGPNSSPAVGDISDDTGIDYVGNHRHHARKATASDHLRCTITSFTATGGTARCDGQIAIGGSMLLANDARFTLSNAPHVISINAGTGIYRHAHGPAAPPGTRGYAAAFSGRESQVRALRRYRFRPQIRAAPTRYQAGRKLGH